jgi:hypothetical protein
VEQIVLRNPRISSDTQHTLSRQQKRRHTREEWQEECKQAFAAHNFRLFFVTDQVPKGKIDIEYCPIDAMTGNFMTKPLHGKKFGPSDRIS